MKDIISIISLRHRKPVMIAADLVLVNVSLFLAFMVRFDWYLTPMILKSCLGFMIGASVLRIVFFWILGLYQWSFGQASINEVFSIFKVVLLGTLALIVIAFFTRSVHIGRSVLLIDFLFCFFLITFSRFLPQAIVKFKQSRRKNLKKALIVGAGSAGEMAARELLNAYNRVYDPIGFIDDNILKKDSRIHGIKVLGTTDDIKTIVRKYGIEDIIIALPSAGGHVIRNIVSKCEKTEAKIKIVPPLHKILTGEIAIKQIRDVEPVDLMGRETVEINTYDVNSFLRGKTVLVTGAAGTIGGELVRQIMKFTPRKVILYDHNENDIYFLEMELAERFPGSEFRIIIGDIKDIGLLKNTFSKYKPEIVFHSAAHKHVPLMEKNPSSAVKNNIIGTRNLMYAAEHYKAESFVMISTDKAVNPTSVMGASKRVAEMMIQAKAARARTKFMAVRFGNVIGSSGSVVPVFKKQIEKGGPVTVTHPEVRRFFMAPSEAAQLVIQAAAIGKGGEIFILDMGEQIKIIDLAKNLITLSGFEPDKDIKIKFIGLRPGEKMGEETLLDIEHDKATKYDKIYITQPEDFNALHLRRDIKTLEHLSNLMEEEKIIEKIKSMVPNFNQVKI